MESNYALDKIGMEIDGFFRKSPRPDFDDGIYELGDTYNGNAFGTKPGNYQEAVGIDFCDGLQHNDKGWYQNEKECTLDLKRDIAMSHRDEKGLEQERVILHQQGRPHCEMSESFSTLC